MRLKFGFLKKECNKGWKDFCYILRVIASCRTYEQLLTAEGWYYQVMPTDKLYRKEIQRALIEKEYELQRGYLRSDLQ